MIQVVTCTAPAIAHQLTMTGPLEKIDEKMHM